MNVSVVTTVTGSLSSSTIEILCVRINGLVSLGFCKLIIVDAHSLGELIEALDDPAGDPMGIHAALRYAYTTSENNKCA